MPIRDSSSILKDGPKKGDIYTENVIDEVKRNNPNLVLLMFQYIATGAAEIYSLPGTITTA
ncbi:MAG: hypothetical protein N3D75_03770 [Candidatus Aenigmarchaeota archaeon]|nr:hypothetical protein [Candidatus Aenigmarchaeota archaeon]